MPLPPLGGESVGGFVKMSGGFETVGDWANLSLVAFPQHLTLLSAGPSFILNKKVYRSV